MSKLGTLKRGSQTALLAAFYRSVGNKEHKNLRVGSDRLAKYFLPLYIRLLMRSGRLRAKAMDGFQKRTPGVYEYVLARTAFFDDVFTAALNGKLPQIVLLGAGYDSRAYRFSDLITGSRIIELDHANTQSKKIARLKKYKINVPKQVTFAAIDFNRETINDVLQHAGFQADLETLFLWEGVCMYLEPKSVDAVFDFITSLSNRKSTIAFDYAVTIPPERIEKYYGYRELSQTMKAPRSGESFKFFIPEGMAEHFLSQRGMTIVKTIDHAQMEKTFLLGRDGRPIGKPNGMFRLAIAKPS